MCDSGPMAANSYLTNGASKSLLEDLCQQISINTKVLSEYLSSTGYSQPSFDRDGPPTVLPPAASKSAIVARQHLKEAARKVFQLASGPNEYLENIGLEFQYAVCLRWLCHFKIFSRVPLDGAITYTEVASEAKVSEAKLKAVARMAMTNNLFHEPKPDYIAHSGTSALLVTNLDYNDWATSLSGALFDVGLKLPSAMEKWPESEEKNETAYQLAFDTTLPFFGHMSQQPQKMKQFAGFMRGLTALESNDIRHLVEGFDWASLGKATVVDVGGSTGHACINLAKAYPDLTFVVQDLPRNAEQGKAAIAAQPNDITARISFQAHDFFQAQPIEGAQVYLLRTILHDWPAKEARTILANIFAAMEAGSRILIMDIILPAAGSIEPLQEGTLRNRDLLMMGLFNSKQRYLEDWTALVDLTDATLTIRNVVRPFNSAMSVIEVGHREQKANGVH